MKTSTGVNLQNSVTILFQASHMILEKKKKLNLLTGSVVVPVPAAVLLHYFIGMFIQGNKNRTELFV